MADRNGKPILRPSFERLLDPEAAQQACLQVYQENCKRCEPPSGSSEDWTLYAELRRDLWLRARENWERITHIRGHLFPLNESTVARLYVYYRKRGGDHVEAHQLQENQ